MTRIGVIALWLAVGCGGVSYVSERAHTATNQAGSRTTIEHVHYDTSARLVVTVKLESPDGAEVIAAHLGRPASPPCSLDVLPSELDRLDRRRHRLRFAVLHQQTMGTELDAPTTLDLNLRGSQGDRCLRVPFGSDQPGLTWRVDRPWFLGSGGGLVGFVNPDLGLNVAGGAQLRFGRVLDDTWLWLETGIGVAGRVGRHIEPGEEALPLRQRTRAVPLSFALVGNHPLVCAHLRDDPLCLRAELGYEADWVVLAGPTSDFLVHGPRTGLSLSLSSGSQWHGFDDTRLGSAQLEVPVKLLFDRSGGTTHAGVGVGAFVVGHFGL